jgi:hypothetical protein
MTKNRPGVYTRLFFIATILLSVISLRAQKTFAAGASYGFAFVDMASSLKGVGIYGQYTSDLWEDAVRFRLAFHSMSEETTELLQYSGLTATSTRRFNYVAADFRVFFMHPLEIARTPISVGLYAGNDKTSVETEALQTEPFKFTTAGLRFSMGSDFYLTDQFAMGFELLFHAGLMNKLPSNATDDQKEYVLDLRIGPVLSFGIRYEFSAVASGSPSDAPRL